MSDHLNEQQSEVADWPPDAIAFHWAETLSTGEQSVLLTSSLRRLQNAINTSRASVVAPQGVIEGPSSTEYEAWLETRPDITARFETDTFKRTTGYEIWRNSWLRLRELINEPVTDPVSTRCEVSVTGRHRIDPPYCKDCGQTFAPATTPPAVTEAGEQESDE